MAKEELGTKRICLSCEAKFYDLNKNPIICPKCGVEFKITDELKPETAPATPEVEEDDDLELAEDGPEIISLEEAEIEEDKDEITEVADVELEAEEVIDINTQDEYLEEDERDPSDVSDIIRPSISGDEG